MPPTSLADGKLFLTVPQSAAPTRTTTTLKDDNVDGEVAMGEEDENYAGAAGMTRMRHIQGGWRTGSARRTERVRRTPKRKAEDEEDECEDDEEHEKDVECDKGWVVKYHDEEGTEYKQDDEEQDDEQGDGDTN